MYLSSSLFRLPVALGQRRCLPDLGWDGTHKLPVADKIEQIRALSFTYLLGALKLQHL